MKGRVGSIAVAVLVGLARTTPAHGDWQVHRSWRRTATSPARDAGGARAAVGALRRQPQRVDLAARLVRGLTAPQVDSLLKEFEQEAAAAVGEYAAQLAYAQVLLAARRWSQAADRFSIAAALSPMDAAPRWGRALALDRDGKTRAALADYRAALAFAREPSDAYRIARALVTVAGNVGDAEAELEGRRAWAKVRPRAEAVLELAMALEKAGHPGEAADVLADRVNDFPHTTMQRVHWALAEGRARAAAGDLEGAARAFHRAKQQAPRQERAVRGEIWDNIIDIARRRGTLEQIRREVPAGADNVDWAAQARIADQMGDLRAAWLAYEAAVRRSPSDLPLRLREVAVAERVGSASEVAALYERLVAVAAQNGGSDAPSITVEALNGLWRVAPPAVAAGAFERAFGIWSRRNVGPASFRTLCAIAVQWGEPDRADRCWTTLLRRYPADELAMVALGEVRLQRGQRHLAIETWRGVLRGGGGENRRADRHARLGEILADHDLHESALAEARKAIALDPNQPRHHRLLASIFERQARLTDAEKEWEIVLRQGSGKIGSAERGEARGRLVALWMRGGDGRLEAKLRQLQQAVERDASDDEALLFLVQVQLRTGKTDAAIASMKRALIEPEGTVPRPGVTAETAAELLVLLVRTLRQTHRTSEAMEWLEQLSRRFPARAHDVGLQLADLALLQHADRRAQEYAEAAAISYPDDSRVVLRAASVEERLGHWEQAVRLYRQVLVSDSRASNPAAALSLAALLSRMHAGALDEQVQLLREVLRRASDDDLIASAGAQAVALEEGSGTLEALEAYVADTPDLNAPAPEAAARRRVLAAILWRVVPPVYRDHGKEPVAAAKLDTFARHGVRPLLDLIDAPGAAADARTVEVLGLLGRTEAVPALARLLMPDVSPSGFGATTVSPVGPSGPVISDDLAAAVVVALGRLGGQLARATLESFASGNPIPTPALRLPLLWALGRVGGIVAIDLAREEIARNRTDGAVVACLTLSRAGGRAAVPLLLAVAEDALRPPAVRAASLLALGLGPGGPDVVLGLRRFAATADATLAASAQTSLDRLRASEPPAPDEALAIEGGRIDAEALLLALRDLPAGFVRWRAAEDETGIK